jgi:tagatose-1,6-bisphosphate aldolase
VLAGRSIWAEAATITAPDRDRFLATTARHRLRALSDIVDGAARPWTAGAPQLRPTEPIPDDWYRA